MSNHAKKGQESRHNLVYWRAGDWIGIGPGAHGRLTVGSSRIGTETHLNPAKWLENPGESLRQTIPLDEQAVEYLLMGLRLRDGIDLRRLQDQFGLALSSNKINDLLDMSLIEREGEVLRTSRNGRPLLNAILRELIPD